MRNKVKQALEACSNIWAGTAQCKAAGIAARNELHKAGVKGVAARRMVAKSFLRMPEFREVAGTYSAEKNFCWLWEVPNNQEL